MSDYSKSQEYRVRDIFRARGFSAERVPLSGACAAIGKGDVCVEDGAVLVDHKSTRGKKMITIHREHLEKIKEQSGEGLGVLTFSYMRNPTVYAILTLEDLLTLLRGVV